MHFDLAQIPEREAYKLLVSTVVPRPIALATTVDAAGRVNAAPFSFFNAVSSRPPVVVLGISPGDGTGDGYKDTERNIRDSGEFVVNLVDEGRPGARAHLCAGRGGFRRAVCRGRAARLEELYGAGLCAKLLLKRERAVSGRRRRALGATGCRPERRRRAVAPPGCRRRQARCALSRQGQQ